MDTLNKLVKVWRGFQESLFSKSPQGQSANCWRNIHSVCKIAFRNIFAFPKCGLLDPHLSKHRNLSLLLESQVLVTRCKCSSAISEEKLRALAKPSSVEDHSHSHQLITVTRSIQISSKEDDQRVHYITLLTFKSFSHLHAKINLKQLIDSNSTFLLAQDSELLCLPEKETSIQAVKGFLDVCDQQRWVFQETL